MNADVTSTGAPQAAAEPRAKNTRTLIGKVVSERMRKVEPGPKL